MTKEYVVVHDFGAGSKYYARDIDSRTYLEVYDPRNATAFPTKGAASKWLKHNVGLLEEYARIEELEPNVTAYLKFLDEYTPRRVISKINHDIAVKYNPKIHTIDDVIKLRIVSYDDEEGVPYSIFKTWPDLFTISKYIFTLNAYEKRNNKESIGNLDYTFSIRIGSNFDIKEEIHDFMKELDKAIEYTTYIVDDHYVLNIMDHMCGENGDFAYFHVPKNWKSKGAVFKIQGKYSTIIKGTLDKILEYWRKNRYYD